MLGAAVGTRACLLAAKVVWLVGASEWVAREANQALRVQAVGRVFARLVKPKLVAGLEAPVVFVTRWDRAKQRAWGHFPVHLAAGDEACVVGGVALHLLQVAKSVQRRAQRCVGHDCAHLGTLAHGQLMVSTRSARGQHVVMTAHTRAPGQHAVSFVSVMAAHM